MSCRHQLHPLGIPLRCLGPWDAHPARRGAPRRTFLTANLSPQAPASSQAHTSHRPLQLPDEPHVKAANLPSVPIPPYGPRMMRPSILLFLLVAASALVVAVDAQGARAGCTALVLKLKLRGFQCRVSHLCLALTVWCDGSVQLPPSPLPKTIPS
jgi:hypothetical protein